MSEMGRNAIYPGDKIMMIDKHRDAESLASTSPHPTSHFRSRGEVVPSSAAGFDMSDIANFSIDCDDDDDDNDNDILLYDTIAMDDTIKNYSIGNNKDNNNNKDKADDDEFALATRTSLVISGYRDYLSRMEDVTTENRRLANEMSMLRDSLGMSKCDTGRGRRCDDIDDDGRPRPRREGGRFDAVASASHFIDIDDGRIVSNEDSTRPFLMGRVSGRLACIFLTVIGVMIIVVVAFDARTSSSNVRDGWDEDLANEEWNDAMEEKQHLANGWRMKEKRGADIGNDENDDIEDFVGRVKMTKTINAMIVDIPSRSPTSMTSADRDDGIVIDVEYGPAMKLIEYVISHPGGDDIEYTNAGGTTTTSATPPSTMPPRLRSTAFPSMSTGEDPVTTTGAPTTSGSIPSSPVTTTVGPSSPAVNDEAMDGRLHPEEAGMLYRTIEGRYEPKFYDDSMGWSGYSYPDAAVFCASHYPYDGVNVGVPCPFEVYCPEGPNGMPYGGVRSTSADGGISYAPILDEDENWLGWVQLSMGHSCVAYNYPIPEPTPEQTDRILCCRDVGL